MVRFRRSTGLAVLVAVLASGCQMGREVHEELHGPLYANNGSGSYFMAEPDARPNRWYATYGLGTLCVHEPGARIELQDVGWRAAKDAPPLELKVMLRQVDTKTRKVTPVVGVGGTPRKPDDGHPLPGRYIERIAGTRVTQTCSDNHRGKGGFTELLFVVKVGKGGMHLPVSWIDYLADGEEYRLMLRWEWGACGDAIEARHDDHGEYCRDHANDKPGEN